MEQVTDLLYVGSGRTVAALDRLTGLTAWRIKLPRLFAGNIVMLLPHGSELYVGRGGYVYCLDRFNGSVLWERGVTSGSSGLTVLAIAGSEAGAQQAASAHHAAAAAAAAAAGVAASVAATTAH